jgi:hypothetical protein
MWKNSAMRCRTALASCTAIAALLLALLSPLARAAEPLWVYDIWSSYDELSDTVPLTEELAMRELAEIVRLRRLGVRIDYYLMDAFWYARDGGYRTWRRRDWPGGPGRWIEQCRENGILPGLWFGTNTLTALAAAPRWRGSLNARGDAMALYAGGFLEDFVGVLDYWYDRGVRMFKLDFADLEAVRRADRGRLAPEEARSRNAAALRAALLAFRQRHPDAVLLAFNGFGGDMDSTASPLPFRDPVEPRWLEVFDALFSGDPRPADVPEMNFWRSVDIYSDHMVRQFEASGVPLRRIESAGFMIGDTGTNYRRAARAWQGMLLLSLARGGAVTTLHGTLEFLDEDMARWLAGVQSIYAPLQRAGSVESFGGIPGAAEPYGFVSRDDGGALYTVVNPSQSLARLMLPRLEPRARLLFRDAGFEPELAGDAIRLGPGQLALVGTGRYADPAFDLGVQEDVRIPRAIRPLAAEFAAEPGGRAIDATLAPPARGDLRVVLQQRDADGSILRGRSRASMGKYLVIAASQGGRGIPVEIRYDKVIWSGLSWAVGEIHRRDFDPAQPIRLRLSSAERGEPIRLEGKVYAVEY